MKRLLVIVFLAMPIINFSQESDLINDLSAFDWLLGSWENTDYKTITIEKWERLSPDTFEGINYVRNENEDAPIFSESLRILFMKGEVFYLAKVDHNEMPVPFKLISSNTSKFIFENMNHDFPQRLTYMRAGTDSIIVRVESLTAKENRSFELKFGRVN